MLDTAAIVAEIRAFMEAAGAYGLTQQAKAEHHYKPDNSIITDADLGISAMFKEHFAKYLAQPGHILIDEETPNPTPAEAAKTEYQWVLDPIDGTASYAGGAPFWGIIIGVMRKGEPWLAATYIPALKLYFWADEQAAYEETDAFTPAAKTRKLGPVNRAINHQTQFTAHSFQVKQVFTSDRAFIFLDLWGPMMGASAAAGYVAGNIVRASLWDFIASWTLALRIGHEFINLQTGQGATHLSHLNFTDKWQNTHFMFAGNRAIFDQLKPHFKEAA